MKKNLPIGISTLANIVEGDYLYVDKTHHVYNLISGGGKYYFLSRPRRFGKSLLVDTLKQAFLGNKVLFKGLFLENNWDWKIQYPVIHISFGGSSAYDSTSRLKAIISNMLESHAKLYGISLSTDDQGEAFSQLIQTLALHSGQKVVLLIDEYDKPILDVITKPEEASENREILKGLYGFIKENDAYLKFVLLTGVSKFSKVSLFSGLNNLQDITLHSRYADICGYTQAELERECDYYLQDGRVDLILLKNWYNGYNFAGSDEQKVYNPFDILLFFSNNYIYSNYWFETATPSFLIKLLEQNKYYIPQLENLLATEELLGSFDIDKLQIETLLFQTGYLTIVGTCANPFDPGLSYRLGYPNFEVRKSLSTSLIDYFIDDKGVLSNSRIEMSQALLNRDFAQLKAGLMRLFAGIPYNWYIKNNIAEYEGFYATVIYSMFNCLGLVTIPEDSTNKGRIDLSVDVLKYRIIMEFKLDKYGDAVSALEQIRRRNYAEKYKNKPVYLMGISFNQEERNISDLVWEEALK